jgi:hypothetical protein
MLGIGSGRPPLAPNLIAAPNDFSSDWLSLNIGSALAPAITANAATAPDGTATADRIVFSLNGGTTASDFAFIYRPFTTTAGRRYLASFWLRASTPCNVLVRGMSGADYLVCAVTSTWTRFDKVEVAGGASGDLYLGLRGENGSSASATVEAWGALHARL